MTTVSFHFHGYQPGDIVRWRESDPLKPPSWEERMSPVSHAIGSEHFSGRNWTDAVLRSYGRLQTVLERVGGAASVDIEPQTLVWLLQKDPEAYRRIHTSFEKGTASLALTPPFHPILPHVHRFEREVLFDLMIDFHAPLLRSIPEGAIGLWLPEAAYSQATLEDYHRAARRAAASHEGLPNLARAVHLLLDSRQFSDPGHAAGAWASLNDGIAAMGRDHPLSSDFAFGSMDPAAFCDGALRRERGSILVASDLESLLANPAQAERFEAIVRVLGSRGVAVRSPVPPSDLPAAVAAEYSSWSDYDEYVHDGHTSDTRWTGLRRYDGVIVPRMHRGRRMSQLWKHAFTLATERIETAVRRAGRKILRDSGAPNAPEALRALAVAYMRHLFRDHYRAGRLSSADVDFEGALGPLLGGRVDPEVAGHVARGYLFMLMGLRSDPRFWDNPDTRVTFQNVAFLAHSLVDLSRATHRVGDASGSARLLGTLRTTLLQFSDAYGRLDLHNLRGLEGWETTEDAWLESLQSEVPNRSGLDVMTRAALFAVGRDLPSDLAGPDLGSADVVADTGHIVGEAHGQWENPGWCEHRPS